jgi:hypothetical protein
MISISSVTGPHGEQEFEVPIEGGMMTLNLDEGEWSIFCLEAGDLQASGFFECPSKAWRTWTKDAVQDYLAPVVGDAIKEWEGSLSSSSSAPSASMANVTFSLRLTPGEELSITPHYAGGPYLVRKLTGDMKATLDAAAKTLLGAEYPVMKTEAGGGTLLLYSVMKGEYI